MVKIVMICGNRHDGDIQLEMFKIHVENCGENIRIPPHFSIPKFLMAFSLVSKPTLLEGVPLIIE